MMPKLFLFDFHFIVGRGGDLDGKFVVDQRGKDALDALIQSKTEVYFGEVLGKHSEVRGAIEPKEITPIAATDAEIETVLRVFGVAIDPAGAPWATLSGFNPLAYHAEFTECVYAKPWDDARFLMACRGEATE